MVRCKRKDPPGLGYLLLLEWSPEVVVAYLLGWWLGTSDACGRSPWQLVPGVRLPRSRPTRRWRASPAASLPPITPTGLPAVPGQRPRLGSTAAPSDGGHLAGTERRAAGRRPRKRNRPRCPLRRCPVYQPQRDPTSPCDPTSRGPTYPM